VRVLATGALLAGLWGAQGAAAWNAAPPEPPRCPVRVEVVGPERRSALVCAAEVPRTVSGFGGVAPAGLRDGDRVEVAAGGVLVGRMPGPALRLLRLPIDINAASVEDLQALPGIGPELASRLAAGRPYRSIGGLAGVPGIGRKRLAALAQAVEVAGVIGGRSGAPASR